MSMLFLAFFFCFLFRFLFDREISNRQKELSHLKTASLLFSSFRLLLCDTQHPPFKRNMEWDRNTQVEWIILPIYTLLLLVGSVFVVKRRRHFPLIRRSTYFLVLNTGCPIAGYSLILYFQYVLPCGAYVWVWDLVYFTFGNVWLLTCWKVYFLQKATEGVLQGLDKNWFLLHRKYNTDRFHNIVLASSTAIILAAIVLFTVLGAPKIYLSSVTGEEACYALDGIAILISAYLLVASYFSINGGVWIILFQKLRKYKDGFNFKRDLVFGFIIWIIQSLTWTVLILTNQTYIPASLCPSTAFFCHWLFTIGLSIRETYKEENQYVNISDIRPYIGSLTNDVSLLPSEKPTENFRPSSANVEKALTNPNLKEAFRAFLASEYAVSRKQKKEAAQLWKREG
jgi:hypothetical protein